MMAGKGTRMDRLLHGLQAIKTVGLDGESRRFAGADGWKVPGAAAVISLP
jgi:hypothetical protein